MNAEGQVKKGRKYDQVVDGARAGFMREGFEGASVDEIARDAGVSKATLYSYFPDKQQLFIAVLQAECDQQSEIEFAIAGSDMPVPDALRLICRTLVTFVLSDFGQDIFRVCVAEAQRFPELGRAFYESGPRRWNRKIAQYLESPAARRRLEIGDCLLAADQLAQLCRTDLMLKKVFGVQTEVTEDDITHVSDEAVKTFMARYANT